MIFKKIGSLLLGALMVVGLSSAVSAQTILEDGDGVRLRVTNPDNGGFAGISDIVEVEVHYLTSIDPDPNYLWPSWWTRWESTRALIVSTETWSDPGMRNTCSEETWTMNSSNKPRYSDRTMMNVLRILLSLIVFRSVG